MSFTRHHLRRTNDNYVGSGQMFQKRSSTSKRGIWSFLGFTGGSGDKYQRRGPKPVFGTKEFAYNYANIVDGLALTSCCGVPRHSIFVREGKEVATLHHTAKVRIFSIVIPANLFPFDVFRVMLDGLEVLVTCPTVSGPGETVWVFVEFDEMSAFLWKGTDTCSETTCSDTSDFIGTIAVCNDANDFPMAKEDYGNA